MKNKNILLLLAIAYILTYITYSYQIALSIGDIANLVTEFGIPKLLLASIGLVFNFIVVFIMVNLFWLFTSLGITFNRGENLKDYDIKKTNYYIIYFGLYSIHFALLTVFSLTLWDTISTDINLLLKYLNIFIVIMTFVVIMWYMSKKNINTKISVIGISFISVVNIVYTFIT